MSVDDIVLGVIWAAAFYHVEPQFDWAPCDIPREQKDATLRFLRAYEDADRPCHAPVLPCATCGHSRYAHQQLACDATTDGGACACQRWIGLPD